MSSTSTFKLKNQLKPNEHMNCFCQRWT